MSATPTSPPRAQGPFRPRAMLIPLSDATPPAAATQWYLGVNGTEAHHPARNSGLMRTPPQPSTGLAPERSACDVFLTQVLAGPEVPRCPVCETLEAGMP